MHSLGRKLRYYTPNFLLKSPSCKVYINISSFSFQQDKYLRGIALSCKLTMVMMAVVPFCWPESLQTIKICGLPSQFYQHFFIKKHYFSADCYIFTITVLLPIFCNHRISCQGLSLQHLKTSKNQKIYVFRRYRKRPVIRNSLVRVFLITTFLMSAKSHNCSTL